MSGNTPPVISTVTVSRPSGRKHRWIFYLFGGFLAFVLLVIATVALTLWWIQRPIKPVVLSTHEKAVVEDKLRYLERPNYPGERVAASTNPQTRPSRTDDRIYMPGSRELKITEREINGLLNQNTDLGQSVRLEFAKDAINAYLAVPIPNDFPIGGGRMFRARGRFALSLGNGGAPYASLEDVTVFGLSLPKAWLGGIKGENLLADAIKTGKGDPVLQGIKSLRIEPGALVVQLED